MNTFVVKNISLYLKLFLKEFIEPLNYLRALIIGAIINALLGNGIFSSIVPFLVPIIVQSISRASVKFSNRHLNLLVKLPQERNDPAFVINNDGYVILSKGLTQKLFEEKGVNSISDIFDSFSLHNISMEAGEQGLEMYSDLLQAWYIVKIKPEQETNNCLVWMQNISKLHETRIHAESMALFGKLNPEPVIRCKKTGEISESNPAANQAFSPITLARKNIEELILEASSLNIPDIIKANDKITLTSEVNSRIFRFMFRGIKELEICQIYGSDITERVLAEQKISLQNKNIKSSIEYASRIQKAILPSPQILSEITTDHFVFFKPRDIVSGDYYWVKKAYDYTLIVAADCTGHGVPGALMSMLGVAFLNEIASRKDCNSSAKILEELRRKVKSTLSSSNADKEANDGMDISLALIHDNSLEMQFSGAYNNMVFFRDGEQEILKADRMPIGNYHAKEKPFTLIKKQLKKGDTFYLFSDGYSDQFGGTDNTKYLSKRFKAFLQEIHSLPMNEQYNRLSTELSEWKGAREQIDDILVLGVRV